MTLTLQDIHKKYDTKTVLKDINIQFEPHKMYSILGPSGCGKTTLLKIICGIETQDRGAVLLNGRDISQLPIHERNIGLVFQRASLFPHLNVAQNLAYGLDPKQLSKQQIDTKIKQGLQLIQLDQAYLKRQVQELSGGEQQRLALLRTILHEPAVILMDEPFSSLDTNLRINLRDEIRAIQQQLNLTIIMVTHHKEDAYAVSDKMAVLHHHQIQQFDTPVRINQQPANKTMATFLDSHQLIEGEICGIQNGLYQIQIARNVFIHAAIRAETPLSKTVTIGLKAARLFWNPPSNELQNEWKQVHGHLKARQFNGDTSTYHIAPSSELSIQVLAKTAPTIHPTTAQIAVYYDPKEVIIF